MGPGGWGLLTGSLVGRGLFGGCWRHSEQGWVGPPRRQEVARMYGGVPQGPCCCHWQEGPGYLAPGQPFFFGGGGRVRTP